jgi:hypothetical protein
MYLVRVVFYGVSTETNMYSFASRTKFSELCHYKENSKLLTQFGLSSIPAYLLSLLSKSELYAVMKCEASSLVWSVHYYSVVCFSFLSHCLEAMISHPLGSATLPLPGGQRPES